LFHISRRREVCEQGIQSSERIAVAFFVVLGYRILQNEGSIITLTGIARRALDTAVGRDATNHQVGNGPSAQEGLERRRIERTGSDDAIAEREAWRAQFLDIVMRPIQQDHEALAKLVEEKPYEQVVRLVTEPN
jgi:hypothetical protein